MHTTKDASIDISSLRGSFGGPVVTAGEDGYDAARQAWVLTADLRPVAVAHATSAEDVAAAVRFAGANKLRIAMQSTGHGASPLGALDDTLLVKTAGMDSVEIDAAGRRARAGAGVQWRDVSAAAGAEGLAALHGSAPDAGVAGYTLGGGIGWLSRRYGLACNSVLALEAVTADGELVRCDAESEPELFWALRGGGGAFAAVTAIEFALYPVAEAYAGWLVFEETHARDALHAFREWAANAPEEITTSFRLLHLPPLPPVPEPLRDRPVAAIDGAFLGSEADAAELLGPLRECAPLLMDSFAMVPAADLARLHGDPEEPVPVISDGVLVADLTHEAAEAFIEVGGPGSDSPLLSLELRQLGGALSRPGDGAGALEKIDAGYALYAVGLPMADGMAEAIGGHVERVRQAIAPWTGGRYLNFSEAPGSASGCFDEPTYARLRQVKSRYDGGDLFRSNHPVEPAG